MRQETKILTYAKYDELTEEQKLKVLENYSDINTDHNDWYEHIYEDAKNLLGILGFSNIEINFSGFWSQGDGASFTGDFKVPQTVKELKERMREFRKSAPKDNLFGYGAMRFTKDEKEEGTLNVYRINHHYYHYNTVAVDNEDLKEFVRDFSKDLYRRLENGYDYYSSRECIEDTLRANDYEFNLETLRL